MVGHHSRARRVIVGGEGNPFKRIGVIFVVAVIFGVVNAFIKPIVQFISIPLYILTLGLIHIVINALMLWITSWITEHTTHWGLFIDDFWWTAIWAAIVLSIVSWLLSLVLPDGGSAPALPNPRIPKVSGCVTGRSEPVSAAHRAPRRTGGATMNANDTRRIRIISVAVGAGVALAALLGTAAQAAAAADQGIDHQERVQIRWRQVRDDEQARHPVLVLQV